VVAEGDRVVGGLAPGCGRCEECRAGLPEYCAAARASYGGRRSPANGGFARSIALDANRVTRLPDAVDDDAGAFVEPSTVALHGVRRSRLRVGDVACVVGCGPIGLLALQCARIAGAGHVVAVEPDRGRRERALALGADAAHAPGPELWDHLREATGGLRADIAFDCAGVPATLQQSVDLVRRGGSVCMIGVAGGEATVVPMRWMAKEVSVDTSYVFTLEEMGIAAGLIADGRLDVKSLHDGTVALDELGATIDALATRSLAAIKVLVDPTAG
jgi:(R,R)-butanediol dehydrogenase/meso-butanediol dehydrogenase/diacetyl reductase